MNLAVGSMEGMEVPLTLASTQAGLDIFRFWPEDPLCIPSCPIRNSSVSLSRHSPFDFWGSDYLCLTGVLAEAPLLVSLAPGCPDTAPSVKDSA